jgi:hypothetical protein
MVVILVVKQPQMRQEEARSLQIERTLDPLLSNQEPLASECSQEHLLQA